MDKYEYNGPVTAFGKPVANNWHGITYAASEKKARSNLSHQYKLEHGMVASCKVELPGAVTKCDVRCFETGG